MNTRIVLHVIAAASIACAIGGCAKEASSATDKSSAIPSNASPSATDASANGQDWTSNGATACDTYLTPEVVAAILLVPAGHSRRLDARSCIYQTEHAGSIGINLSVADIDVFRQEISRIVGTHPMSGVGDGAYWNAAGAVSAVKGHKRGCDISVVGAPNVTKIRDEALGQKLGEICNKLFALP